MRLGVFQIRVANLFVFVFALGGPELEGRMQMIGGECTCGLPPNLRALEPDGPEGLVESVGIEECTASGG